MIDEMLRAQMRRSRARRTRVRRFLFCAAVVTLAAAGAGGFARWHRGPAAASMQGQAPDGAGGSMTAAVGTTAAAAQTVPVAPVERARAQITGAAAALPELADGVVYTVSPSVADPEVKRFTADNIILFKNDVARKANLLVFFSGTRGTPVSGALFLEAGAKAGYRVIGLTYDNRDSVPETCGENPDPACADRFREKRVFGDGAGTEIDDLPAESAVNRLTKLLEYLDAHHHDEGWGIYLRAGKPDWSRIAVSGHSQGGGIAAYIAKKVKVARVIILSGAWDRVEATKVWAPWITSPSATPMDRWFAAYHQRESRADAMKPAYVALKIPPGNVRVMALAPNPEFKAAPGMDVFHGSMVSARSTPRDANGAPAYAADWAFLLGRRK